MVDITKTIPSNRQYWFKSLRLIFTQLLLLSVLLIPAHSQANDVLSTVDKPEFSTSDQSIWGPNSGIAASKSFKSDIMDLADQGDGGNIYDAYYDQTTAIPEGSTQLLCAPGDFIDLATGDCYSCPDGYSHNPLFSANDAGACFRIGHLTTATQTSTATFLCSTDQFTDLVSGDCYSCPTGYSHNPLLPVSVTGVCYKENNTTATWEKDIGCGPGEFDGLNGSCYSCPSGYSHNPLLTVNTPGVCYKNRTADYERSAISSCPSGYTWRTDALACVDCPSGYSYYAFGECRKYAGEECTPVVGWPCWDTYSYKDGYTASLTLGCGSGEFLSGTSCYSCPSGYSHNWALPAGTSGVCYVNTTASYSHIYGCSSGTFDGLNGSCYSCGSSYNHNPLLTVNTPGVCFDNDYTTASNEGDITFVCPSGEFLDLISGKCATCRDGYRHNPAFPANVPGVCFEQEDVAADHVGDTQFLCPTGSFLDVVTGSCYSCPEGYAWNPTAGVNDQGVCYKLQLGENIPNAEYQVGMETNWDLNMRWGVKGGITVDEGSVNIDYKPAVSIQVEPIADTPSGQERFVIKTKQLKDQSNLNMTTSWPGVDMTFDTYIDASTYVDARVAFPAPNSIGLPEQVDTSFTVVDTSTNGEKTLGNEPMASFHVGADGLNLSLFGLDVPALQEGFNPPVEIAKPVVTDPLLGIQYGYVLVELGLTTPDMATPARTDPPYRGDHGVENIWSESADYGDTYVRNYIYPGSRTHFDYLSLGAAVQDPDVGRFDVDLDGIYASIINTPLGIQLKQPTPIPFVNYWKLSASVLDVDGGFIFSFKEDFKFEPQMAVELTFSKPIQVKLNDGTYVTTSRSTITVGTDLEFIHPGGDLQIETKYDVEDNRFTNNTDLVMTPIFTGEMFTADLDVLLVPTSWLPKITGLEVTADILPGPIHLADLDYYFESDARHPVDDTKSIFTLSGFKKVSGQQLMVTGRNQPPQALCRDTSVSLDASGQATITASDIDAGSNDPDSDPITLTINEDSFNCDAIGDYSVSLTVTDSSGNTDVCWANVSVVDDTAPSITVGPDLTLEATSLSGATADLVANASDTCGTPAITRSPELSVYPLGTTDVTWTATDGSGNSTSAIQRVTVVDTTPPVLTVPANVTAEANGNPTSTVAIGTTTATDILR